MEESRDPPHQIPVLPSTPDSQGGGHLGFSSPGCSLQGYATQPFPHVCPGRLASAQTGAEPPLPKHLGKEPRGRLAEGGRALLTHWLVCEVASTPKQPGDTNLRCKVLYGATHHPEHFHPDQRPQSWQGLSHH